MNLIKNQVFQTQNAFLPCKWEMTSSSRRLVCSARGRGSRRWGQDLTELHCPPCAGGAVGGSGHFVSYVAGIPSKTTKHIELLL